MATVTLIQNPLFIVNLRQSIQEPIKAWQIQDVARLALEKGRSFVQTSYLVVTISFKQIVLNYYKDCRIPAQFHIVAWKVVTWMAGLVWCALTTAGRLFWQKIFPVNSELLTVCLKHGVDIRHMRTCELFDITDVPDSVKVDDLLTIFDQINFTCYDKPGFINLSLTGKSKEDLRNDLRLFIDRVNQKIPFDGTPSIYDTSRLIAFYQQIENGIRSSIHKVNQDIQKFEEVNGEDVSLYNRWLDYDYKALLMLKNETVFNLAAIGDSKGVDYVMTALDGYLKTNRSSHKGSLEQNLMEILASKRHDIAMRLALQVEDDSTLKFWKIVAVPGMENIAELPTTPADRENYFEAFFKEYTIDSIKETIQREFQSSQVFREKIQDWLFMQAGDWGKEDNLQGVKDLIEKGNEILTKDSDHKGILELVAFLRLGKYFLPKFQGDWQTFINELFNLVAVKETWAQRKSHLEALKKSLSGSAPTIQNDDVLEMLVQKGRDMVKADTLCQSMKFEPEIALQIVGGKITLQQAVANHQDEVRRREFLYQCGIDGQYDKISREIMQWLLVSHKILLPPIA